MLLKWTMRRQTEEETSDGSAGDAVPVEGSGPTVVAVSS